MTLPRFYPVFDDVAWLRRSLPLGVRLVQLRLKDRSEADLRGQLSEGLALCRAWGTTLVVNDHWQAAIDLGCDWLHLGQEDLDDSDLGAIRAAGLRLGVSTHDPAELDRALSVGADYVALGAMFPTRVKPDAVRTSMALLREVKATCPVPVATIGGIRLDNTPALIEAGADMVAVISDLFDAPDIAGRAQAFQQLFNS